ncbi:MAG: 4Fe-4S binding protein [Rickettsiales bacterium]|jgi:NAD-dependent dihydropyrimidine dehydrogenase PreA subunit|nr:4Fe-4S binding protein [Rickettsiales bacterium]
MKVLINHKICDMSPACGGIETCPTGALFWDAEKGRIGYDESKCTGCGACEKACPVAMAIRLAHTDAEAKQIQSEYDADPRQAEDLFIDRYGADFVLTKETESDDAVSTAQQTSGLSVIELNAEDLIRCLLMSVPMHEIANGQKWKHIKVMNPSDELLAELEISELPALVFFRNGNKIGFIEGYFEDNDTEKGLLLKKVGKILNLDN